VEVLRIHPHFHALSASTRRSGLPSTSSRLDRFESGTIPARSASAGPQPELARSPLGVPGFKIQSHPRNLVGRGPWTGWPSWARSTTRPARSIRRSLSTDRSPGTMAWAARGTIEPSSRVEATSVLSAQPDGEPFAWSSPQRSGRLGGPGSGLRLLLSARRGERPGIGFDPARPGGFRFWNEGSKLAGFSIGFDASEIDRAVSEVFAHGKRHPRLAASRMIGMDRACLRTKADSPIGPRERTSGSRSGCHARGLGHCGYGSFFFNCRGDRVKSVLPLSRCHLRWGTCKSIDTLLAGRDPKSEKPRGGDNWNLLHIAFGRSEQKHTQGPR